MIEVTTLDLVWALLILILSILLSHRVGFQKGKSIASRMIRQNIKKVMGFAVIILASCSAPRPAVMSYVGQVVLIQGCEVCVSYGNVDESDGSKSLGCFAHYEGHSYGIGDRYPNPEKHSTGIPVVCGTPSIPPDLSGQALKGELARISNNK